MGDLTNNFSRSEFTCKCGCGICRVDEPFILRLQLVRNQAGFAFTVNSGCRCPEHNKDEGGKPESDHLTTQEISCEGVDIKIENSIRRFRIIEAAIDAKFRRIGIYPSFIHLGTALRNPQQVAWLG